MSQQELLTYVSQTLAQLGIAYFVTGSWSSSLHGVPRSTHDLDIVVALTAGQAERLIEAFPPDRFYVSPTAVQQAIKNQTMFNVLDTSSGDKIDFWLLTDEPWDRVRFERCERLPLLGDEMVVSTPEDTILAKLRWCQLSGGSEKQFSDARGVYEVQAESLDVPYLNHWARQLGVIELWNQLQRSPE